MDRTRGPWVVKSSARKYKSEWVDVCQDKVIQPNGRPGTYDTIKLRPGVSVLAMGDEGEVYLTSEYRYAIEAESIEVVSGGIDDNELPESAARRELREELGIEAERLITLGKVHPLTSMLVAPARLFIARGLSFFEPQPQEAEIIRVIKVKLSEAVRMVMESKITHAPSCVLILKASHFLNQNKGR
jgi:8-oxo-dGTP pyrophosphatase MutT (NUDIX family)